MHYRTLLACLLTFLLLTIQACAFPSSQNGTPINVDTTIAQAIEKARAVSQTISIDSMRVQFDAETFQPNDVRFLFLTNEPSQQICLVGTSTTVESSDRCGMTSRIQLPAEQQSISELQSLPVNPSEILQITTERTDTFRATHKPTEIIAILRFLNDEMQEYSGYDAPIIWDVHYYARNAEYNCIINARTGEIIKEEQAIYD